MTSLTWQVNAVTLTHFLPHTILLFGPHSLMSVCIHSQHVCAVHSLTYIYNLLHMQQYGSPGYWPLASQTVHAHKSLPMVLSDMCSWAACIIAEVGRALACFGGQLTAGKGASKHIDLYMERSQR